MTSTDLLSDIDFSSIHKPLEEKDVSSLLYPVAERFVSINGEGRRAGEIAAFIRMKGCNLTCTYCDTAWANEAACPCESLTLGQLMDWVLVQGVANVTLTGGEPLLTPGIAVLTQELGDAGLQVEIETNGSVDITPFHLLPYRPAFTLDYKCPGSGMESFMNTSNYSLLNENDTVKFVVTNINDLDRAYEICSHYGLADKCNIYLSPVFGKIKPEDIVGFMIRHQWKDARLQLQLHKYIWPAASRGV